MTDMTVANEIANQIGSGAFYMLGTTHKNGDAKSLTFNVKGSTMCKYVRVTLEGNDTYTVEFLKLRKAECVVAHTVSMVYADKLHDVIEKGTGLYTKL